MLIPNLRNADPLNSLDLSDMEEVLYKQPISYEAQIALRLLSECRRLQHELADPNYQYSGRIHRAAILSRNAEIDALRKTVEELKAEREKK